MTVILGVIGIIIIGSLGIKILPFLDTQDVMLIFVFFIVPFVNITFLAMLELKFSGEGDTLGPVLAKDIHPQA